MTYKIKLSQFFKGGAFNPNVFNQYELMLASLMEKGINFRLYADTEDKEYLTIVTR